MSDAHKCLKCARLFEPSAPGESYGDHWICGECLPAFKAEYDPLMARMDEVLPAIEPTGASQCDSCGVLYPWDENGVAPGSMTVGVEGDDAPTAEAVDADTYQLCAACAPRLRALLREMLR